MTEQSEWIPWEGGECPVDGETAVLIRFRGGIRGDENNIGGPRKASQWSWGHYSSNADIIAYRIIKP